MSKPITKDDIGRDIQRLTDRIRNLEMLLINPGVVSGIIDKDGNVVSGSRFSVTRSSAGIYNIVFDVNTFTDTPAVVASCTRGIVDIGGSSDAAPVAPYLSKDGCRVRIYNDSGTLQDAWFSFIARAAA